MNAERTLLTLKEVAKRLRVNRTTVARWVDGAGLPAYAKPGGGYWIAQEDLEEWLNKRRVNR